MDRVRLKHNNKRLKKNKNKQRNKVEKWRTTDNGILFAMGNHISHEFVIKTTIKENLSCEAVAHVA